jgi:hypothetical protein
MVGEYLQRVKLEAYADNLLAAMTGGRHDDDALVAVRRLSAPHYAFERTG